MSAMVIVLSLGLFGIIVGVAYWFAREEQKTIKRVPPEEMDEQERQARREAAANIANFPMLRGLRLRRASGGKRGYEGVAAGLRRGVGPAIGCTTKALDG
jgi:hypothetical protein